MRFICDCGQIYSERAAVRECQRVNHSAAAGNELADAEAFAREMGVPVHAEGCRCPECDPDYCNDVRADMRISP